MLQLLIVLILDYTNIIAFLIWTFSYPVRKLLTYFIFINTRRKRRDKDLALSVRLFVRLGVTNLLGLYLKDYYRFEHETSGVYRSHWVEVYCTRTITLHFLILE